LCLPARCFNDKDHGIKPPKTAAAPDHCSAFVATGSYTKDNNAVIAHNSWSSYMDGERRTYVFDVTPSQGRRFMMDAGIAITEKGNYGGYANNWLVVDNKTKPHDRLAGYVTAAKFPVNPKPSGRTLWGLEGSA